eukprot:TRINITY_DN32314_c0_g1_i1.p1 TRINITY_DN32314_c0_g1~~TRINITY_DN32314_c0_g1_i1.p1  ORF type:complete len:737 (-),score=105.90 TRINITY_DN32314_c0_g1_i1:56-2266(-)
MSTTPSSANAVFQLHDGRAMPVIGLGVYRMRPGSETEDAVRCALECGYRLIDTAAVYDNEADVAKALQKSDLRRDEVFITTKLWHDGLGYDGCIRACEQSLHRLQTDYVDLYLMHSPQLVVETWDAMIELQRRGPVRSIGVSNFAVAHLQALAMHRPNNLPVVNQIEMHPLIWQERSEVLEWCRSHNVVVTAYGSLFSGQQSHIVRAAADIAATRQKTEHQVLLRWAYQMGFAVIPKSVHEDRICSNINIFDFELTQTDMTTLCNLTQETLNEYWNPLEWKVDLGDCSGTVTIRDSAQEPPDLQVTVPKTCLDKLKRSCACVVACAQDDVSSAMLEKGLREVQWTERKLEWHHAKALLGTPCPFAADDLFPESSRSEQSLPPWILLGDSHEGKGTLVACISAVHLSGEDDTTFATLLLERIKTHFTSQDGSSALRGAKVVLVSDAKRIPFLPLTDGLASLKVCKADLTADTGCSMLDQAGMFVVPSALSAGDVAALHALVTARIQDAELALQGEGHDIGSGGFEYSEIVHRGKHRWDISLYKHGEGVGPGDAASDPRLEVLKRVGCSGAWLPTLETMLGEVKWEAGCVCSRPGALGQGWHADASPSKHNFDGETGAAPGFCVFIPLVPLTLPKVESDGKVSHGLGCTGFWPGSQRYRACAHLGAAAAKHLEAAVLGAPLNPGDALVYDMRIVHSGSPNDATHLQGVAGLRPILQLSYWPQSTRRENVFGYYQLYCD